MNDTTKLQLSSAPMGRLQMAIIVICAMINALDGFDVLLISFAAPGIATEWGIDQEVLGVVLSMELLGMALGSIALGNLADRIGRRTIILVNLVIIAAGMFISASAGSVLVLCIARLTAGLGIGGMLSPTSTLVAEYSNDKRRKLSVALNASGYSVGAIGAGILASSILESADDWRTLFLWGGAMTLVVMPLVAFFVPESIAFLTVRRPARALERINRTLRRIGHAGLEALPVPEVEQKRGSIRNLFSREFVVATVFLTYAYLSQMLLFYYIQKWMPKIVADMGFEVAAASRVLLMANIGALIGSIVIGLAAQRFNLRKLIITSMLLGFVGICLFGLAPHHLGLLSAIAFVTTFFVMATIIGLFPLMAETYPTTLRASGLGLVIGAGRGGSALGPVLVGKLFALGNSLFMVSLIVGSTTVLAALLLVLLPLMQRQSRAGRADVAQA